MSATATTLILLAIAVVLTLVVGRILLASGEPFLQEVFRDDDVGRSVNRLLSVLFHLVTLGVLTIVAALPVPVQDPFQALIVRTGVVLLIVGAAYGISMLVLLKIRERRRAAEIQERVADKLSERGVSTEPSTDQPL